MISAVVSGNLGKPAELRQAGDSYVCSFSVASSVKVKGEKVTTWVRCSLWGKRGEAVVQYLTQGTKVAVAGELSTRIHDGKTYLELNVSSLDLLGGPRREEGASTSTRSAPAKGNGEYADDDYGADEEDLPF